MKQYEMSDLSAKSGLPNGARKRRFKPAETV